jgi:uncharacterized protein (DUF1697 family)
MNSYVVLLRGINVGGKNTISMAELKGSLEELGYKTVASYINSGNILLDSDQTHQQIASCIEELLPLKFKLDSSIIKVLVLDEAGLRAVVDHAPKGFGAEPAKYHSDVVFLMGITAEEALPVFSPKEGVDRIWPGQGVVYSQRLSAQRTKSRLNKIVGTPAYKSMTIRNWNTTTKLLSLLEARTPEQSS